MDLETAQYNGPVCFHDGGGGSEANTKKVCVYLHFWAPLMNFIIFFTRKNF